jgi:hypothetical protein
MTILRSEARALVCNLDRNVWGNILLKPVGRSGKLRLIAADQSDCSCGSGVFADGSWRIRMQRERAVGPKPLIEAVASTGGQVGILKAIEVTAQSLKAVRSAFEQVPAAWWAKASIKAASQLLWSHKGREEWFSLGENHERRRGFGLHQLRNRYSPDEIEEVLSNRVRALPNLLDIEKWGTFFSPYPPSTRRGRLPPSAPTSLLSPTIGILRCVPGRPAGDARVVKSFCPPDPAPMLG